MKKDLYYAYLPEPLVDYSNPCISVEFMRIGLQIGNTVHVMLVPKDDKLDLIYEGDFPDNPKDEIIRKAVSNKAGIY